MNADNLINEYLTSLRHTLHGHILYATWFREDLGLESSDIDDSDVARTHLIEQALAQIVSSEVLYPNPMDPDASPAVCLAKIRLLSTRLDLTAPEINEDDFEDIQERGLEDDWLADLVKAIAAKWPEHLFSPDDMEAAGEVLRAYARLEGEDT